MLTVLGNRAARFTPRRLPGLGLWLAADRITGLADGAAVATWKDLSGNGYDAAQADAARRPVYRTGILNGRPVVRFDGVDDRLELSGAGLGLTRNAPGVTMFAVVQTTAPGAQRTVFVTDTSTGAARTVMNREGVAGTLRTGGRRVAADAFQGIDAGVVAAGAWSVDVGVLDYANAKAYLYQNGTQVGVRDPFQAAGNTADLDSTVVHVGAFGGTQFMNGDLAELAVCRVIMPAVLRRAMEQYLGRKYGIPVG